MFDRFLDGSILGSLVPAGVFALFGVIAGWLITLEHLRSRRLFVTVAGLSLVLLSVLFAAAVVILASRDEASTEASPSNFVNRFPHYVFLVLTFSAPLFCLCALAFRLGLDLRWRGRCPQCGYDMRNNITGRCPECGYQRKTKAR